MSIIRADSIKNRVGDGAPDFPNGITVTGIVTATTLNQNVTGIITATSADINGDLDVDGHTNLDNVSVAGVVTATAMQASSFVGGTISGTTGTFSGNVSIGGTLTYEDVTNIDSVGLITARNGVRVPGGDISINSDSGKLYLGAGNDLHIFHAGNHSYIQDNGTGALYIGSNGGGVYVRGQHGEESIIANSHGNVSLYYDNSLKFTTETSGVNITGVCTATSFSGDGSALTGLSADKIFEGNTEVETVDTGSDGHVKVTTDGTEKLRIDNSGRLLLGATSSTATGVGNSKLQVSGVGADTAGAALIRTSSDGGGAFLQFVKNRGSATQANDTVGAISFMGHDGTDTQNYFAMIRCRASTTSTNDSMTGHLSFHTSNGSAVTTERMRIDSAGRVTKPSNPCFMVKADSTQSYSGNAIFVCNSPQTSGVCHNIGGHFNTSTGVFTAPIAGRYYLSMDTGPQFLSSNPTDGWQITVEKNGSNSEVASLLFGGGENGYEDHIRADGIFNLAANDTIRWRMSGYGGTMNFVGTKFQGYLVG